MPALAAHDLPAAPSTPSAGETSAGEPQLQAIVDDLRTVLAIEAPVLAVVVAEDPHAFSVEPNADDATWPFHLSVDGGFRQSLTDDEARAAIAHELGHVWVFTHHPYLQTERLANQIAMRAVSRESLARLYQKVWERDGVEGDLTAYLGP